MTPPRRRDWAEAALALVLVGGFALAVQAATGILGPPAPRLDGDRLLLLLIALVMPSLAEELVFRGQIGRASCRERV